MDTRSSQEGLDPETLLDDLARGQQREAATRSILEVISQSREDEKPVFDAILDHACKLCNAPFAGLVLGTANDNAQTLAAHNGMFQAAVDLFESGQMRMDRDLSYAARSIIDGRLVAFDDMGKSELYKNGSPIVRSMVDTSNIRSVLFAPLLKDGVGIGSLTLFRREISPFDPSEVSLAQTFAEQAVIAIENVRQFHEIQTRLERESATREVLEVISRSRDDEKPVFDTILNSVLRLCDVDMSALAMLNKEGTHLELIANAGARFLKLKPGEEKWPIDSDLTVSRAVRERRNIVTEDLRDDVYHRGEPTRVALVEKEGMRSQLVIPLMADQRAIGSFVLQQRTKRSFSQDEISQLQSFAAQAVIAIENVRQFREVQERLAHSKASAEVLDIISRSRADEQPVFEVILESVSQLCHAPLALLHITDNRRKRVRCPAYRGTGDEFASRLSEFDEDLDNSKLVVVEAIRSGKIIQVNDLVDDALYHAGNEWRRRIVDEEGARSFLSVPLLSGAQAVGTLTLYRREVLPFTEDDISLVKGFAAQAVIAIENVRQFKELQALNAELGERVDAQVGEIERMGKLKRFLPAAVADTVISSGSDKMLSSHRALLGVLFCDIRGFTAFCETAEPEETIEVLQTYHQEMGKLINAHGAGVDHRMGDGIMVLFNDPIPCDDPAGNAVRLAVAMRSRMTELSQEWKRMGFRLGFGVGVSLGYATVGMVGYEGRSDYTASGTAINVASRLCEMAEDGEILLSTRASIAVEDDFSSVSAGDFVLKGIREPVEVFKLAADFEA
ncbi:GAF domain-containing protein [Ruegeria arenilitoris]|uniref:GAF domain-containing protein n=1 Tax=Ruegeria arenilitoris TaxID=1173585 RepID=UPI00147D8729|nr:GAF domain-containing protein [Ruegeria arenilitoris]